MSSLHLPTLFPELAPAAPALPALPEGFRYSEDFLSEHEEALLLQRIDALELRQAVWNGYAALRRIASFALSDRVPERYRSDPNKGSATLADNPQQRDDGTVPSRPVRTQPAPDWLRELSGRIAVFLGRRPEEICHALVTEYPAGAPIGWHVDSPPHSAIIGLSLGSDCTFRLRPADYAQHSREALISLTARRRSLYEMAGASRSRWQHGILPVPGRRVSITLRTI